MPMRRFLRFLSYSFSRSACFCEAFSRTAFVWASSWDSFCSMVFFTVSSLKQRNTVSQSRWQRMQLRSLMGFGRPQTHTHRFPCCCG